MEDGEGRTARKKNIVGTVPETWRRKKTERLRLSDRLLV